MIIDYCKDIVQPPEHLNVAFFEEVVENALREANLSIEEIRFTMGSSTGENYCSDIYRVRVQYRLQRSAKSEVLSVIVKSMPHREAVEFLQDLRVFQKEKTTYYQILPRMEMFLQNDERFSARLYITLKYPVNTLVFEDLSCSNFETASRENGLDENHCLLVMRRLGQFHAISMLLEKKDPEIMKHYNCGMLAPNALESDGMLMRFFGGNAAGLLELVSQWPDYADIYRKLQHYMANLRANLCRGQKPLPGELQVLNHGDLWVNNILFKYDQQRTVKDVIFVDYQMSVWGSPGLDLNYFFYTSLQFEVLKTKRESLIREYYNTLRDTLHENSYDDVPSYQRVREEVRRREPFGFFAHYAIYPLISMDKDISGDSNLDNFADEDFARKKITMMYSSKRVQETLKYTLREFDKMGVLD